GSRVLTAGGHDMTAQLWGATTGLPVTPPLRHNGAVHLTAFSPDGSRVVTAGGTSVRVWDAATGEPVTPALLHGLSVSHVSFSSDGRRVLSASHDGTARLWDAATGA